MAVRQLIGYDRCEGKEAFRLFEVICADWRLVLNLLRPCEEADP